MKVFIAKIHKDKKRIIYHNSEKETRISDKFKRFVEKYKEVRTFKQNLTIIND